MGNLGIMVANRGEDRPAGVRHLPPAGLGTVAVYLSQMPQHLSPGRRPGPAAADHRLSRTLRARSSQPQAAGADAGASRPQFLSENAIRRRCRRPA